MLKSARLHSFFLEIKNRSVLQSIYNIKESIFISLFRNKKCSFLFQLLQVKSFIPIGPSLPDGGGNRATQWIVCNWPATEYDQVEPLI
jgi:hypothetical protein